MRNKLFIAASLLVLASMVLAACGPQATPQVITQIVAGTPQVIEVTSTPPPPPGPAEFKSKDPTTWVTAEFGEPDTFDPALAYDTASGEIIQNVYETLVFYKKEQAGVFVPMLAEKWDISPDGKTYTFTIRKGVKFHDGTEMTPSDVAYSLQRGMLQGGSSSPQWLLTEAFFGPSVDDVTQLIDPSGGLMDDVEGVQKVDPAKLKSVCEQVKAAVVADDNAGTVTMKLAQPWGPFLATLANTWGAVMSQKWVVANGGWDGSCDTWQKFYGMTSDKDPFTSIANGTGPFKLDSWEKGQQITLSRNDNYWVTTPLWDGGPTGPAKLAKVIIKSVNEWGTRFAMLQAGDADTVVVNADSFSQADQLVGEECPYDPATGTTPTCKPTNTPDQPLRVFSGLPTINHTDIFLNEKVNTTGGNPYIGSGKLDGNGIPPDFFSDIHIRKAFNYCFNWDQWIKDGFAGYGQQIPTLPLPGMPGYDANAPKYSYDADKCKAEFQASTLKSPDGKSVWDVGFRFQIAYNVGNIPRQTGAQILATNLVRLNPKFLVSVISLPWATLLHSYQASQLPVWVIGWQEDIHDPHNWYQPYLTGTYGSNENFSEDFKKQVSDLVTKGAAEADPAKRDAIYKQLNQVIYDYAPMIMGVQPTTRRYVQRWVNGYYYNPIYGYLYYYPFSKN
jgi:peptide/nickel transport system substrate-binding protein